MEKKDVYCYQIGSITFPLSGKSHIARQNRYKDLILEPSKIRLYQLTKNITAEIAPHISSALIYLGVVFYRYILSGSTKLAVGDPVVNKDSCSGTYNEQKIHRIM